MKRRSGNQQRDKRCDPSCSASRGEVKIKSEEVRAIYLSLPLFSRRVIGAQRKGKETQATENISETPVPGKF